MDRWRASLWLFALALLACALALALEAGSEASRLSLREWATLGVDGGTTSGDETLLPPHPRPIDAGVGASVMSVALEIYDALSQRATSQAPSLPALDGLEVLGSSSLKDMCAVGAYRGHLLVVFRGTQSMDELLRNVFGDQFLASGSKRKGAPTGSATGEVVIEGGGGGEPRTTRKQKNPKKGKDRAPTPPSGGDGRGGKDKGKGKKGWKSTTREGKSICYAFNNGGCDQVRPKGFAHVCQICLGGHRRLNQQGGGGTGGGKNPNK